MLRPEAVVALYLVLVSDKASQFLWWLVYTAAITFDPCSEYLLVNLGGQNRFRG